MCMSCKNRRPSRKLQRTELSCAGMPIERAPSMQPARRAISPASVPESDRPWRSVWSSRASVHALAVCGVIVMMRFAAPLLLPIVLSVMLFYMLDPIVDRLQHWRIPRLLATLMVVFGLVAALGAGVTFLWPQIDSVLMKVPAGTQQLRRAFRQSRRIQGDSALERIQAAARAVDTAAAEAGTPTAKSPGITRVELQQPWRLSDRLWTGGLGALGILGQAVTVLFLTIFLLYEDDSFKRKLVAQMGNNNSKRITVRILNDIATQIGRFIWVQALMSVAVAVATWLALWWLGIAEPAVWGVLAGVLNIVPYFGPLIVTAGLAIVGFLQFGTFEMAALVAGVALVITTCEGMFLTPHLISRSASLNHVAIFLAIAFWSWAWGVPGMLLAVPMLMVFKAVCDHVEGLKGIGRLVGQ
jgi:predicted PurR-regulated permease PerM